LHHHCLAAIITTSIIAVGSNRNSGAGAVQRHATTKIVIARLSIQVVTRPRHLPPRRPIELKNANMPGICATTIVFN
jgi:hypothetical protein